MAQLKLFTSAIGRQKTQNLFGVVSGQHLTITAKHYSSSSKTISWDEAKPISECATASTWDLIRGFLPGGKFYKKDVNYMLRTLFKEKGDIVYMPGIFGKADMVMTQNPDDIEMVFRHEGIWPHRTGFEVLTYHRNVHRKEHFGDVTGLLTTQGKAWGDFRSAVNQIIIHPKNVKIYLPIMSKINQEFIERIKTIRDPNTLEMPANFKEEISAWTLESVSVVALDKPIGLINGQNPIGKRFFDHIQNFLNVVVDLEVKPSLWRQFPNLSSELKKCMAIIDDVTDITEQFVNEAMERINNSTVAKPDSELSVLEKLVKIDKKVATTMAMDMLFAGVDTTTSTFTGLLLCLAKNPEKQQKLRKEIRELLPNKDSELTVENMKNLPYLRACIKESLRLYPLGGGNIRTLPENVVLSGYRVLKDTEVAMMNINLLEDPSQYSSPKEFAPERWLRQSASKTAAPDSYPHAGSDAMPTKSSHPFVYLPFGFGPRSCIGRRLAEMELEIGAARVIRNFNVEFNYSVENAFKASLLNVPAIPLKFKFTDITD